MENKKVLSNESKKLLEEFDKITAEFRKNVNEICDKYSKMLDEK